MSRLGGDVNAADELLVSPDASLSRHVEGAFDLTTPASNWSWALIGTMSLTGAPVGVRLIIDLELFAGKLGIFVSDDAPNAILGEELIVERAGRQQITLVQYDPLPTSFCVRSVDSGAAEARVFGIQVVALAKYDVSDIISSVMPAMLLAPGRETLETIARELSRMSPEPVLAQQIGALELAENRFPIELPALTSIFSDDIGQLAVAETQRLTDLLVTFQPEKLAGHLGYLAPEYWRRYFRQNIARVYHLVQLLRDLGLTGGSVLEVGTLMGNFSATLQQLGYEVTAVDRYRAYDGALRGYTAHMRSLGVCVVETEREDEDEVIRGLGQYDAVISMAVIEHIPHTPRLFLKMLASHVKPGGILALDTPNIAHYWNRLALSHGHSVHQDIAVQFNCEPPYEGHHREYTGDELVWMMEQVGCSNIELRHFDYNLFGFESLEPAHITALLEMTLDPTQADTILAAGRVNALPL